MCFGFYGESSNLTIFERVKSLKVLLLDMQVLRNLPVRSLSCKVVVKRSALSLEGFVREYFLSGSPVIITDCMAHWPARTKWNDLDYLERVAGDRTIPVEVIVFVSFDKVWLASNKLIGMPLCSIHF